MADIKFACPHCKQHITCDELWGGHQLECPSCKNTIQVPAAPAHPPVARVTGNTLVPQPPPAPEPRLAINTGHSAAQTPAGAPQRTIPIRNLTAPPPKKKSKVATFATIVAVLAVLGAGGYFGYGYINKAQDNLSKNADKSGDGGQVAHIAKLNSVLDATDPNRVAADTAPTRTRQRRAGVGQEIPVAAGSAVDAGTATNAASNEPVIPAVWTLDLTKARIPSGRANGSISGTNFVPDTARVDTVGKAQILRLLQGQPISPDREVLVYLHLKPGETLGGQTLNVSQEMAGSGVPQVTKRWKNNPKFAPAYKSFTSGYAMRLELGQAANGSVPGKIFLALPDLEQSVVAGNFTAVINTNVITETTTTVQSAPTMTPTMNPTRTSSAADAAWQARYGTRRSQ